MTVWLVGAVHHVGGPFSYYDVIAVEETQEAAFARVGTDSPQPGTFVGPLVVGQKVPADPLCWEGIEWPFGEAATGRA